MSTREELPEGSAARAVCVIGKTLKPILDAMLDWGTDYKKSL